MLKIRLLYKSTAKLQKSYPNFNALCKKPPLSNHFLRRTHRKVSILLPMCFRQAYLPYFLLYQNVKERWINKSYLFFHHSRLVSNLPFWVQRYNMYTAKSKFFGPLISHLESFPHPKIGIQPFIHGLSRAFSTHEKKWNRDITFYLIPIIKTYETVTFFLTPMLLPPHLFTTDPS